MINKVRSFNEEKKVHTKKMPAYARILDIASELGELGKEYLKGSKYGTKDFEINEEFKIEYGDILYSLLSLADELNFNAEDSLDNALDKYKKRIEKSSSMGSGV